MFVKNKENIDFNFRKNDYLAVLKANTVSYVDETKVSPKELLACYGQRIEVISRSVSVAETKVIVESPKKTEKPQKTQKVKKEDLDDSFIEEVLKNIVPDEKDEEVRDIKDEIAEIINKEVADFLNGKTDKLPAGTEVITDNEAKKLEDKEIKKEETSKDKGTKAPARNKASKATKAKTGTRRGRAKKA